MNETYLAGDINLTVSIPYRSLRTLVWEALSSLYEKKKDYNVEPKWWELEDLRNIVDKHFKDDKDINGLLEEMERI